MSDKRAAPDRPGFLTITEAAEAIGCSAPTLRSRIRAGDLNVWINPADRRQRLVLIDEVAQFRQPQRVLPTEAA